MLPEDPIILLSVINTRLRDDYASLDELCGDLELDRGDIERRLAIAGFSYDPAQNRFR